MSLCCLTDVASMKCNVVNLSDFYSGNHLTGKYLEYGSMHFEFYLIKAPAKAPN